MWGTTDEEHLVNGGIRRRVDFASWDGELARLEEKWKVQRKFNVSGRMMKFPIRNEYYSRVGFGSPKRFFFAPFREISRIGATFPVVNPFCALPANSPAFPREVLAQKGGKCARAMVGRLCRFPVLACRGPPMASWRRNQGSPSVREQSLGREQRGCCGPCCVIKPYKEAAPAETLGSPLEAGPSPAECTALVCPRSESTERNDTKTNFFPPTRRRENALGEK